MKPSTHKLFPVVFSLLHVVSLVCEVGVWSIGLVVFATILVNGVCVCVRVCVCERERESMCVCEEDATVSDPSCTWKQLYNHSIVANSLPYSITLLVCVN